jgi:hypothetical protein
MTTICDDPVSLSKAHHPPHQPPGIIGLRQPVIKHRDRKIKYNLYLMYWPVEISGPKPRIFGHITKPARGGVPYGGCMI